MTHPLLLAGAKATGTDRLTVAHKHTQAPLAEVHLAGPDQLEQALAGLARGQVAAAALPRYARIEVLRKVSGGLLAQADELTQLIIDEAGKPRRYAEAEVRRAAQTFHLAADYLASERQELLPLDLGPGLEGKRGLVGRVPIGPVLGIAPFNFPLNLVAHKLAPSLMAGCAFLLKPASATPLSALRLGELILEAGYPPEAVNVVPFSSRHGNAVVADPRTSLFSFTGSPEVGWPLKALAGRKKVVLELGGDAAALIAEDADLDAAAASCAAGAFAYAGQICISIQRIVVVQAVYAAFCQRFLAAVDALPVGDPNLAATVCGPLIDRANYDRVAAWLSEAETAGTHILRRGARVEAHNLIGPTVLAEMPRRTIIAQNEAFAPLVELIRVPDFAAGLAAVNASRYGLQTGVFTQRLDYLKSAWATLEVGAVLANEAPTLRIDAMPYGGVKDSGFGREGTRYGYEDYTEPRLLLL